MRKEEFVNKMQSLADEMAKVFEEYVSKGYFEKDIYGKPICCMHLGASIQTDSDGKQKLVIVSVDVGGAKSKKRICRTRHLLTSNKWKIDERIEK